MHHNGWSVPELAHNFGLSEPEVLAALLHYSENKAVIDAQDEAEQSAFDQMVDLYGDNTVVR